MKAKEEKEREVRVGESEKEREKPQLVHSTSIYLNVQVPRAIADDLVMLIHYVTAQGLLTLAA